MQQAVQVLVDEPAIDREFTYSLPAELASGRVPLRVGTIVRVPLHGRNIRGWVTDIDASQPRGVELLPITRVASVGPPPSVVDLTSWAAWRWAGTRVHFLRTASADRVVAGVPPQASGHTMGVSAGTSTDVASWIQGAIDGERMAPTPIRLGPCADTWPLLIEAVERGRVLVLVPTVTWAAQLAGKLRQAGVTTALAPRDWAGATAAHAVVGTRAAAWAPCDTLDSVIVFDEHDEAYQSEAAPTWNARDVAVERARLDGAVCFLVGPMPSPDTLALVGQSASDPDATVLIAPPQDERESWPRVEIVDRREDDPATGEWCSDALADLLRSDRTVVCVLNRTGRARLAYCASCGELAVSERSGRALRLEKQQFVDAESGEVRPAVCEACGTMRFRRARVGVKGVAEEMERLALRPVIQVVGETAMGALAAEREGSGERHASAARHVEKPPLYIGTEAVLHRVPAADAVVFLDFDQELSAPRYRAGEESFALLVRAARLAGPRSGGGRILVQTRMPSHPVLLAAVGADPSDWVRTETARRSQMRQPPASAWALVSGEAAGTFIERLRAVDRSGVLDIAESASGTWRIRCDDRVPLLDALSHTERPPGRLRVAVDPLRA